MSVIIEFLKVYEFNTLETGITVPIKILSNDKRVSFFAKIDTGSTHCFFERKYAEQLGIKVESGQPLTVSTATGTFLTFGHQLTLSVLDIEEVCNCLFYRGRKHQTKCVGQIGVFEQCAAWAD